MNKPNNKVALVVGASSRLGQWASELLGREGYYVGVNDWAPEACERLKGAILAQGGMAGAFPADPSKKLAFQTMLEHFLEEHERIDLLVNASAIEPPDRLLDMDEWDWRRAMELNVSSVFVAMQSVGRVMRELGGGRMLNLIQEAQSSDSLAYRSAIAAVAELSNEASKELAPLKISLALVVGSNERAAFDKLFGPYLKA